MHISNKLPQFTNERALILVSGTQHAEAFRAHNGVLEKLTEFRAELPDHSERSNLKHRASQGQTMGVSSLYEDPQKDFEREFMRRLKEETEKLKDDEWDQVYLFGSAHALPQITKALSKPLQGKVAATFPGNYTKEEPFALLKRIQKVLEPATV